MAMLHRVTGRLGAFRTLDVSKIGCAVVRGSVHAMEVETCRTEAPAFPADQRTVRVYFPKA